MIENTVFWVWAQNAFGEGSGVPWHIYRSFPGGLEEFYHAGPRCWGTLDYVSAQHIESLSAFDLHAAMARLEYAIRLGWDTVTPESEKYPEGLRNISDPPAVLYIKGELRELAAAPWIAVAGARKASEESLSAAKEMGFQLASAGAVVVSGMAPGVDSEALQGALFAAGRTVCVMPVDLSSPYLSKSAHFRRRQLELGGVLVSEYFSQRSPAQGGFHLRNRLITGMSRAAVLIQAGEKSGTMIYARHAVKQKRKLFVYPGQPEDPAYAGSRKLLAQGAVPVRSGWEAFQAYTELFGKPEAAEPAVKPYREEPLPPLETAPELPEEKPVKKPARRGAAGKPAAQKAHKGPDIPGMRPSAPQPVSLQDSGGGQPAAPRSKSQLVLEQLGAGDKTTEELAELTGIKAGELLTLLARLELEGQVERVQGRRYRRT